MKLDEKPQRFLVVAGRDDFGDLDYQFDLKEMANAKAAHSILILSKLHSA